MNENVEIPSELQLGKAGTYRADLRFPCYFRSE